MDIWSQMSSVVAQHAAISSDQPLANNIGLDILKMGGNAADAAVATMVAVSVIQPYACGIGGDCQCLFYKASDKKVYAINGSGRSGHLNTLDRLRSEGIVDSDQLQSRSHGLWVSVPGAVAGMCNVVQKFGSGKLTMEQILQPAINLAETGVPIPAKASYILQQQKPKLAKVKWAGDLLNDHRTPGDLLYAPKLASSLRMIASKGAEAFYCGRIAENIVKEVQSAGGVLTLQDMEEHLVRSRTEEAQDGIYTDFHGFRVWEMKPNTIGIVVLVALNILKLYDLKAFGHNSAEYIHVVSEAIKHAFLECWEYLCDPDSTRIPIESMSILSHQDVSRRSKMEIDANKVLSDHHVITGGNTSYVAAVDQEGNGCSFINSVFSNFGARLIPEDCGFVLHDRLKGMSLNEESPNVYGPNKLPLHTIIPTIITHSETNQLIAVMGLIGRWMQPQGKIQLLLNMMIFGMDPQTALNKPRFFVGNPLIISHFNETLSKLNLEEGIPDSVIPALEKQGHNVTPSFSGAKRQLFGNGNIIARSILWNKDGTNLGSWWAGADPRADGSAVGF